MKVVVFVSALVGFGALTAQSGFAQYHPPANTPPAKHYTPPARSGSVGGPANKPSGINGTGKVSKH
ncbi:MAG TPA: hypothetical protein VFG12_04010 [Rhodopila sp.]|nr:hypothetical protein [Rhodopila sp.]